jgi:hypothetical protein
MPDDIGSSGIVPTTIVANIPQLAFSIVYLAYNNLFTRLLLADEFARFATHRKGLRVSEGRSGQQRSTRFLSLPVRYGVPLMAYSVLLHWLLSQSLFLVRIDGVYANGEVDIYDRLTRLGYSTSGVIAVIAAMTVGTAIGVLLGVFQRLDGGVGDGSNSVVISAACHPLVRKRDMQARRVKWGDITPLEVSEGGERHAGFDCDEVGEMRVGAYYA